jgi:hypothetical protein
MEQRSAGDPGSPTGSATLRRRGLPTATSPGALPVDGSQIAGRPGSGGR